MTEWVRECGEVALGQVQDLFPVGPMEEAELQVFPDTGSETELVDAVGDGQVCVNISIGVWGVVGEPWGEPGVA